MTIGKIVNGNLVTPSNGERKKVIIVNPTDEQLMAIYGYKEIVESDEIPDFEEGVGIEVYYEEENNKIVKKYRELEVFNETDVSDEDATL